MSTTLYPLTSTKLNFQGTLIHEADPFQELEIVVHFHQNPPKKGFYTNPKELDTIMKVPSKRKYLNHQELEALVGASHDQVQMLTDYLKPLGIKLKEENLLARTATYTGTVDSINKAFKTKVSVFQGPNKFTFLAYNGYLQVPANIYPFIIDITGITTLLKTEFRIPTQTDAEASDDGNPKTKGYTARQLAEAYNFPTGLTGKGECIAIIELGGRYKESDLEAYFKMMDMKMPKIEIIGTPIDDSSFLNNSEVTLDIEVAATVAPDAKIVVYYGHTILEAMRLIIQDKKNKPSVVSISWAGSEYNYSPIQVQALNRVFYEAALLGITVIAASGDRGAYDSKQFPNVSIPSSSPLVIGCGGTTILLDSDESINSEVVWNQNKGQIGSGGGFSVLYPLPGYQKAAVSRYPQARPGNRGVPDVAANADGVNGYKVIFNGMEMAIGGTSASTPLWAGLIALFNEALGYRLGFINTHLYQFAGSKAYQQITQGNNGYYHAAPYWNAATGLGSPNGKELLELFKKLK